MILTASSVHSTKSLLRWWLACPELPSVEFGGCSDGGGWSFTSRAGTVLSQAFLLPEFFSLNQVVALLNKNCLSQFLLPLAS